MIKVYKYTMNINDVEFNDVYDYEGMFLDHDEAYRFLCENESVGNTITILNIEEVEIDPAVLDKICRR